MKPMVALISQVILLLSTVFTQGQMVQSILDLSKPLTLVLKGVF